MLKYTPVHLAYARPFSQKVDLEKKADVQADRADDVVELNLRVDLSHLLIINLILNLVLLILMINILRK